MEWRKVVGYEGFYEVNEFGDVKSLSRERFCGKKGSKPQIRKEKIVVVKKDRLGYMRISLSRDSKAKLKHQHRIVAEAFIPNPENKREVNHKDGDKTNNSVNNLEWVTRKENMKHASENGLIKVNKDLTVYRRNTKIDLETAKKIRNRRKEGFKLREIAKEFGVSEGTVSMICKNLIWKEDL